MIQTLKSFSMAAAAAATLVAIPLVSFAAPTSHPLPKNQCYQGSCSPVMEEIWNSFESAGAIAEDSIGSVFSGECFHRSPNESPTLAHHGVVYFSEPDGTTRFSGRFAFHMKQNPYAAWTPEIAAKEMPPRADESSILHREDTYAWVDFNAGKTPIWQYYVRQSEQTLWVVALWGHRWTVFCQLERNASGN